ncbi:Variant-specific surface protein, partial [Giardia duodenalis]
VLDLSGSDRTQQITTRCSVTHRSFAVHLSDTQHLRPARGGCYNARAAPGSGVCREARDGACVIYREEVRAERAGAGEARNPRAACTADSSGSDGTCKVCGVHVSESEYCSECNSPDTHAPVNGQCADVSTEGQDKTLCPQHDQGKCTQCGGNSLLYMGGCYSATNGLPGYNLCLLSDGNGVCTEAASGYFLNPLKASDKDSVVACSDTTGFTADSKTYKGVENCETCDGSALTKTEGGTAKCTRCQEQKYLKVTDSDTQCVDSASNCGQGQFGKPDPDSGNRCVSCTDKTEGVTNCATCEYNMAASKIRCTKCTDSNYLKTAADGTTTCVTECGNGYFKNDNGGSDSQTKVCVSCGDTNAGVPNCAKCTAPTTTGQKPACSECNSGFALSEDKTTCTQDTTPQCTTPDCRACDNPAKDSETCTECNENKYLTPTAQCIDNCGKLGSYYAATDRKCKECTVANCAECDANGSCKTCSTGFYFDTKECKACDSSCKSCSGATNADCTACPSGKALKYDTTGNKGTCGEGCVVNAAVESGNCKVCGLTVEGTAYCSACATDSEYPQNGVCAPKTTRATATCSDASISGGVCNACSTGYFKMNGGCYETTRYPGKSVCTSAPTGGTCASLASGYYLNGGTLVTCPEGCKVCNDANTCATCVDGYVKLNNAQTCSKCDAGCATCTGSASTCSTCADGYYKTTSGGTCTSCESNSGGITGVRGCASCAAPTGGSGPVLCYLVGAALLASLLTSLCVPLHCCSCHTYRQPPAGCVTWWQSAPEAVTRTPLPPAREPAPSCGRRGRLITYPRRSSRPG